MLNRHKRLKAFSSHYEERSQDNSIFNKSKQNYSFIISRTPVPKRSSRSLSQRDGRQKFSLFSNLLLNESVSDKESLFDDNLNNKLKVAVFSEENLKLKSRLAELIKEINIETYTKSSQIKKKFRNLQIKASTLENEARLLSHAIRSFNLTESLSKLDKHIQHAIRTKHLIIKLTENHSKDSRENPALRASELHSLRKENAVLSQETGHSLYDLGILKSKLSALEKAVKKPQLKAKIEKLKYAKKCFSNESQKITSEFQIKEKELSDKVNFIKSKDKDANAKYIENQKLIQKQEIIIVELKEKLEKIKAEAKFNRMHMFIPVDIRHELVVKLLNPPRVLVKINQILSKKKMLISVFLSLLDKNNNGLLHLSSFIAGMKEYGQPLKSKHLQEIKEMFEKYSNFIPLRKLEELFDRYKYDADFIPSSDEEKPKKKKNTVLSITLDTSENGNFKEFPRAISSPVSPLKLESVTPIKLNEISNILNEIKEQMLILGLKKVDLGGYLFKNSSNPDALISLTELIKNFKSSGIEFKNNEELIPLLKYLIEVESKIILGENDPNSVMVSINTIVKRLNEILPDWEVKIQPKELIIEIKVSHAVTLEDVIKDLIKNKSGIEKLLATRNEFVKEKEFIDILETFSIENNSPAANLLFETFIVDHGTEKLISLSEFRYALAGFHECSPLMFIPEDTVKNQSNINIYEGSNKQSIFKEEITPPENSFDKISTKNFEIALEGSSIHMESCLKSPLNETDEKIVKLDSETHEFVSVNRTDIKSSESSKSEMLFELHEGKKCENNIKIKESQQIENEAIEDLLIPPADEEIKKNYTEDSIGSNELGAVVIFPDKHRISPEISNEELSAGVEKYSEVIAFEKMDNHSGLEKLEEGSRNAHLSEKADIESPCYSESFQDDTSLILPSNSPILDSAFPNIENKSSIPEVDCHSCPQSSVSEEIAEDNITPPYSHSISKDSLIKSNHLLKLNKSIEDQIQD